MTQHTEGRTGAGTADLPGFDAELQFCLAGRRFAGRRHMVLLRKIAELGTLTAAARAAGMSYKAAWDAVEAMNNLAPRPLVESAAGGRHGGGSRITAHGLRQLRLFERVEVMHRRYLNKLHADLQALDEMEDFRQLMERLEMKSSARNQFHGTVLAIASGPVNAEVTLDIGGGNRLVAMITQGSVERLGLSPGNAAYALVKATSILLTDADDGLRLSTRNRLCGEVVWCREGAVNGEVTLDLGGGKTLTSILTNESIGHLELREGMRACAVFKASSVILATR
ncbi:TOBE domain-containing protein [Thioalbus denitrificans]|uniref:Molybdate transport system regulatory protein n=1 Tax=Thioalbus denitrificans TaxID=547122 RepID=A0A369CG29_9GAMM|nr:TOBE domain-containing protein [Thioalbus denitrificans]RCX32045.1 molybdate transport system regulatory protein [Thioalbus denitrificans]